LQSDTLAMATDSNVVPRFFAIVFGGLAITTTVFYFADDKLLSYFLRVLWRLECGYGTCSHSLFRRLFVVCLFVCVLNN
jgi:hypothetical protein